MQHNRAPRAQLKQTWTAHLRTGSQEETVDKAESLQETVLGSLHSHMEHNVSRPVSATWHTNHLECIKALNGRLETVKLVGEDVGRVLFAICLSRLFGRSLSDWARAAKETRNKRDHLKCRRFCPVKETIDSMQRQRSEEHTSE